MTKRKSLPVWAIPIHFADTPGGTLTKGQYEERVNRDGAPVSWRPNRHISQTSIIEVRPQGKKRTK